MNTQQARIRAVILDLYDQGFRSINDVPVDLQAALAAEGYVLSDLDDRLFELEFNFG